MRYIDPADIEQAIRDADPDWFDKARRALEEIRDLPPEELATAINARSEIWRTIKETLKGVGHHKCWYCESNEDRSDNAVDHFRPKNRVAECKDHPGYWWLAFDWTNYRFSCTFCNSKRRDVKRDAKGGKHDHFPLLLETQRVSSPDLDIGREQPLLLDPTRRADPELLWFDEDGQAVPNPRVAGDEDSFLYRRADESIDKYHLNHTDIVERRKNLFREIKEHAAKADRYLTKMQKSEGDDTAQDAFEDHLELLIRKMRRNVEDSRAARAMLMGLRGTSVAAETALAA